MLLVLAAELLLLVRVLTLLSAVETVTVETTRQERSRRKRAVKNALLEIVGFIFFSSFNHSSRAVVSKTKKKSNQIK